MLSGPAPRAAAPGHAGGGRAAYIISEGAHLGDAVALGAEVLHDVPVVQRREQPDLLGV
jgi:hypothetical protein